MEYFLLLYSDRYARWEIPTGLALKSHLMSSSSHLLALLEKGIMMVSQNQSGSVVSQQGSWSLHEVQKRGKIADSGMVWECLYGLCFLNFDTLSLWKWLCIPCWALTGGGRR